MEEINVVGVRSNELDFQSQIKMLATVRHIELVS